MKKPRTEDDKCYGIDDLDTVIQSAAQELLENDHRNKNLEDGINRLDSENCGSNSETPIRRIDHINTPYSQEAQKQEGTQNEHLYSATAIEIDEKRPELKDLPSHLEYAYLKGDESCPVIISSKLTEKEKVSLLRIVPRVLLNPNRTRRLKMTTFTCPYRTFAYRRMPFGLCNALATFQRCMTAIFHDMVEDFMEVFMDDFSVFDNSFDQCLNNLDKMLGRCEETNLVLNWEKCHFMVKEGIVLGHKISGKGIEVDKAKINIRKGAENLATNHLSRLENPNIGELAEEEIEDKFPDKHLMILKAKLNNEEPGYVDYVNIIVGKVVPPEWTPEKKK
ncbi:reverse transcriptase domain-containing protein [Tanacetum coccineum]